MYCATTPHMGARLPRVLATLWKRFGALSCIILFVKRARTPNLLSSGKNSELAFRTRDGSPLTCLSYIDL
eukprot:167877-Pyramimonas_sp.AAC.1